MEFIREFKKVINNKITINLPSGYRNKEVEVIVLPVEKKGRRVKRKFNSLDHISIDTRKYKFNREELHER